jgi:SAM-dependent methyltransferase
MINFEKDPIGHAIFDFSRQQHEANITVLSSLSEDDIIPVDYLFRGENDLPELETMALDLCKGRVLDVGAGAGVHAKILAEKGLNVSLIDTSLAAVEYHLSQSLQSRCLDFFDLKKEQYDTLLLLMNGFGIAGKLEKLDVFLKQCHKLLEVGGCVIGDSTDVKYFFEDDEGGYWLDLNSEYYGNFDFQMRYKETLSEPFDWLYVDYENLAESAEKVGFTIEKLYEQDHQYLVKLTKK